MAVSALRKALGELEGKRYIETIPKSGYRFVAPVAKFQSDKQGLDDGLGSALAPGAWQFFHFVICVEMPKTGFSLFRLLMLLLPSSAIYVS